MTTRVPDEMLESGGGGGPTSSVPAGVILPYAGTTAPTGFLLCFGQDVSRVDFAPLFAILGTTYGVGDGTTTFGLPDLRGRLPLGRDNMGGTPANRVTSAVSGVPTTLGATGGDQRLHGHNHGVTDPGHTHGTTGSFASNVGADDSSMILGVGVSGASGVDSATTGISVQSAGAGASQNIPPVLVLHYIIKT